MAAIEKELVGLAATVEAGFEFLEEEQRDIDFDATVRQKLDSILKNIQNLKQHFNNQRHIKQGVRIALIGAVNVGKSTLFNTLLQHERALVSHTAGTTRDTIEASLCKNGVFRTLIDTAGLRQTDNQIEQAGIDRSWHEAAQADIILLVYDVTSRLSKECQLMYHKITAQYPQKTILPSMPNAVFLFRRKPGNRPPTRIAKEKSYIWNETVRCEKPDYSG